MPDRTPGVRLILAGLAVLASAAASLAAGATAAGMLARVVVGGVGFYALGAGIDKALTWAGADRPRPVAPSRQAAGEAQRRGGRLDVRLPPVSPDGGD
jgi:hypothetical protein